MYFNWKAQRGNTTSFLSKSVLKESKKYNKHSEDHQRRLNKEAAKSKQIVSKYDSMSKFIAIQTLLLTKGQESNFTQLLKKRRAHTQPTDSLSLARAIQPNTSTMANSRHTPTNLMEASSILKHLWQSKPAHINNNTLRSSASPKRQTSKNSIATKTNSSTSFLTQKP